MSITPYSKKESTDRLSLLAKGKTIGQRMGKKVFGKKMNASVTYRYLSLNIHHILANAHKGPKLIASSFTGPIKPATDLNLFLAFSMAGELGAKVLVVETILKPQKKSLSDRLGFSSDTGYLHISSGKIDVQEVDGLIVNTAVEGVDFLTSGASDLTSSLIFKIDSIRALISHLNGKYDYILFLQDDIRHDTRHMQLCSIVDMNLLVLEENKSFMHDIEESKKRYAESGIKNLQLVLTS